MLSICYYNEGSQQEALTVPNRSLLSYSLHTLYTRLKFINGEVAYSEILHSIKVTNSDVVVFPVIK
jgi:hypothetical protein